MADGTKIEWADATVNAINGCTVVSPGCTNCYAMRLAGTRMKDHPTRAGLTIATKAGPVWNGEVRLNKKAMLEPLRWAKPRMIFWNAHGDMFHPNVPDEWIDRCFAVMALTPQHIHQVLTKRSARMRAYMEGLSRGHEKAKANCLTAEWQSRLCDANPPGSLPISKSEIERRLGRNAHHFPAWPLPNVWLGVSAEDQTRADERIPDLLATPAVVRWVSAEPLIGPIDFRWIAEPDEDADGVIDALLGCNWIDGLGMGVAFKPSRPGHHDRTMTREVVKVHDAKIDWVVAGDESGPNRRRVDLDDVRSIRDQCAAAGTSFFLKQLHIGGKKVGLPDLDGRHHNAMPKVPA